jgi:uncharacterized protein YdaU (DUF1376 family)
MNKHRPWMPLYVQDYLADTQHLTTAEHGAYLLLLMFYWTHGGIPNDEDTIRRITKMSEMNWKRSGKTVLDFFTCVCDTWHNKRADLELAKAIEKSRVNSTNVSRRYSSRSTNVPNSYDTLNKERKIKTSFGKDSESEPPDPVSVAPGPIPISAELIRHEASRRPIPPGLLATALVDSALTRPAVSKAELPSKASKPSNRGTRSRVTPSWAPAFTAFNGADGRIYRALEKHLGREPTAEEFAKRREH